MKAIMVMFDSLNRHMLEPYGCDWVKTPNFARLARHTALFDTSYVGSMPCMPARRELHTGRYNFLHRSWSPLEPFDDSMPQTLKQNGVHTHLVTDHQHYWEDGGATYHGRYTTFDLQRGQEGDPWHAHLPDDIDVPRTVNGRSGTWFRQDCVNRHYMPNEEDMPQARTFSGGMEFLRRNHAEDNWFLQIETFDPHEPYYSPQHYKDLYPHEWEGDTFDWPTYGKVTEDAAAVQHMRYMNAALVSMCDTWLGKVLDLMDELDLWKDTLLIVNTDHGFLLGEHDFWAKCCMPFYEEIAHTPLFIWDPRTCVAGARRKSLVQTIDLPATILDYFGLDLPPDMQGKPLRQTIVDDSPVREAAIFGIHGGHVNVTDGHYVYMRAPTSSDNQPLYNYTLMPTHMRGLFSTGELAGATLSEPFSFTKGVPTLKVPSQRGQADMQTLLFDVQVDPQQLSPLDDVEVEARMVRLMKDVMAATDAPSEQYSRLGLE